MTEIYLEPNDFQEQVDEFESGANEVKQINYSLDKQDVRLKSVERYMECVDEFNATIQLLGQLLDLDTQSMKRIKASWMNLDNDIATKTLVESLCE